MTELPEPTPAQAHNVEVTARAFAAFMTGDLDVQRGMASADAEIFAPKTLANAGSYLGPEGFLEWTHQWLDAWDDYEIEVISMEPVGERHVIAACHQKGRGKTSGVPVEMGVTFMSEIEGERFTALHIYPTTEEARAVAEGREAG